MTYAIAIFRQNIVLTKDNSVHMASYRSQISTDNCLLSSHEKLMYFIKTINQIQPLSFLLMWFSTE